MFTVIELPEFTHLWPSYWTEDEYDNFIEYISVNPFAGQVVRGSGGVRKIRWRRSGSGKSGGVRIIYFTRNAEGEIILITLYAKAKTASLPASRLKELRHEYEKISATHG